MDEEYPQVSVELNAKSQQWQEELENRIIPGVPYIVQLLYIVNIIAGLIAWGVSNWVWDKGLGTNGTREDFELDRGVYYGVKFLRYFVMIFVLMGVFGAWCCLSSMQAYLAGIRSRAFCAFSTWPFRKLFAAY